LVGTSTKCESFPEDHLELLQIKCNVVNALSNETDIISYFRKKWYADLHGLDGLKTD
jgi:hypothetical protein